MKMNKIVVATLMFITLLNADSFEKKGSMVYDSKTKLSWERNPSSKKMNWQEAVQHCKSLELRLPNLYELKSLVDHTKYEPAIRTDLINIKTDGWYWTSSSYVGESSKPSAWLVSFGNGNVNWIRKTNTYYVLCVSGQ